MTDPTLLFRDKITPALRTDAVRFWIAEEALTPATAAQRAELLLGMLHDPSGALIAVATGVIEASVIGQPLVHYRTFVGRAHRRRGHATRLLQFCFDGLSSRSVPNAESDAIGVLLQIPRDLAGVLDPHLEWPHLHFTFIGRDAKGQHLRVRYFEKHQLRGAA